MIYEGHGLRVNDAIREAFNEAKIEATVYVPPYIDAKDAVCTVDTTKHDKDVRRKFAEWYFKKYFEASTYTIDRILSNYEKEQK